MPEGLARQPPLHWPCSHSFMPQINATRVVHTLTLMYAPFRHPSRSARGTQSLTIIVQGLMPGHCQRLVWPGGFANPSQILARTVATHGQLHSAQINAHWRTYMNDNVCATRVFGDPIYRSA
jgi:hypothetical protein